MTGGGVAAFRGADIKAAGLRAGVRIKLDAEQMLVA